MSDKKSSEAKKYYLMAIEDGDTTAMCMYANILKDEGNIEEAKKYYLKAIEKDDKHAMNNYACLLKNRTDQSFECEKYFLNAIRLGNTDSIYNYGLFLSKDRKKEALKYFYKYYTLTKNNNALTEMKEILNIDEMAIFVGEIMK